MLLALFLLLTQQAQAATAETYSLSDHAVELPAAQVFIDRDRSVDFDKLKGRDKAGQIQWERRDNLNFGFSPYRWWLKIPITNQSRSQNSFILDHRTPLMKVVNVYIETPQGLITYYSGRQVKIENRVIPHKNFLFPFDLKSGESATIYVEQIANAVNMADFEIYPASQLAIKTRNSYVYISGYLAIVLGIAIASFGVFCRVYRRNRDLSYLRYSAYVFSYFLFQATVTGMAYEFIWPGAVSWNEIACPVLIPIFYSFTLIFTMRFLETAKYSKFSHLVFSKTLWLSVPLIFPIPFFLSSFPILRTIYPFYMDLVSAMLIAIPLIFCRKSPKHKSFGIIFMAGFIGNLLYSLRASGDLPNNFITNHLIQLTSLAELFLFATTLGNMVSKLESLAENSSVACHNIQSLIKTVKTVGETCPEILPETKSLLGSVVSEVQANTATMLEASQFVSGTRETSQSVESDLIAATVERAVSLKRAQSPSLGYPRFYDNTHDPFISAEVSSVELRSIIGNLINNSENARASKVDVSIHKTDHTVEIHVSDNGIGIREELKAQLFDGRVNQGTALLKKVLRFITDFIGINEASAHVPVGIGFKDGRGLIQSWGGTLSHDSKHQIGTKIVISLPIARSPVWLAKSLQIIKGSRIVALDDHLTSSQVWVTRIVSDPAFMGATVEAITNERELLETKDLESVSLFLVDYELAEKKNGLDLIEQYGLAGKSVLVTQRWNDETVRNRAANLGIQIIPKHLSSLVSLIPVDISSQVSANDIFCVLIDDEKVVRSTWLMAANFIKRTVLVFESFQKFLDAKDFIPKGTKIFVDFSLGVETGDVIISKLQAMGFSRLFIVTGYKPHQLPEGLDLPVLGKQPFWQTQFGKKLIQEEDSMSEVVVRKAKRVDLEWINELYLQQRFGESNYDNEYIAVAEVNGSKVGVGRLVRLDAHSAEIGGIVVLPEYRGRRIGNKILEHLIESSQSYSQLLCTPLESSVNLYAEFGFSPCSESSSMPEAFKAKYEWRKREGFPVKLFALNRTRKPVTFRNVLPFVVQKSVKYMESLTR